MPATYLHADLIDAQAKQLALPPTLIAAHCEVESEWQVFAIRFEPAFLTRYVSPRPRVFARSVSIETERMQRATSWGVMQVMGQTARELGAQQPFLSELSRAEVGIRFGCLYLARCRDAHFKQFGWDGVIAAYNAGTPRRVTGGQFANQGYVDKVNAAREKIERAIQPRAGLDAPPRRAS